MDVTLKDATALLTRTPSILTAMLNGIPAEWSGATEGGASWSPRIIVAHLLYADQHNWIPRARVILSHGAAVPLPAFDQEGQARTLGHVPLEQLLSSFAAARAQSLGDLATFHLDEVSLARTGLHPVLGQVTLRQLIATWVAHDLSHIAQIARVMAKQCRDAVGPWRVYLPILER